ncbi:protein of unknown function [Nitrosospira multiformis]|uniref:DUF4062 domain-containing protein n=1 Tax=Nitrosospira multiformis TaxID=1231 RepID=A0A1H8G4T1_9PROT|nr:DUF4062 domain-containing protein [Nitrosospira multiformis]SEN38889.1 protein of unknown function [Nitrosospira multiformis]
MTNLPEFRIYLSSTIEDLKEERDVAINVLRRHGLVMDSYRASEKKTVATCISDVHQCNLYIGIIGRRYGWVPDGEHDKNAKSITELEYEACRTEGRNIPRLIYLKKGGFSEEHIDAIKHQKTAERIESFRDRCKREQQSYEFSNSNELQLRLTEEVISARTRFHRDQAPGQPIFDPRKHWNCALRPVTILSLRGSDDDIRDQIIKHAPTFFSIAELSSPGNDIAWQLDQGLQAGQLCCLLVTPTSLPRMTTLEGSPRFGRVINILRQRQGLAVLLCLDIDPQHLPPEWQPLNSISMNSGQLSQFPLAAVKQICDEFRSLATVTNEPRLALPCIVIAPTLDEAESLVKAEPDLIMRFDEEERDQRLRQFKQLASAASALHNDWPRGMYGNARVHWRCFGSSFRTVQQLIQDVVNDINKASRGSRERQLLHDAEIIVRHYSLDEYLDDMEGSKRVILSLRDKGCLFMVDELALLHPRLREASRILLATSRSAIVSISPCDPAHLSTHRLLGEFSFLHIGSIVSRFKAEQDPQCELALNNEERVCRWLRVAIPRLIIEADGFSSQPNLVNKIDELLG